MDGVQANSSTFDVDLIEPKKEILDDTDIAYELNNDTVSYVENFAQLIPVTQFKTEMNVGIDTEPVEDHGLCLIHEEVHIKEEINEEPKDVNSNARLPKKRRTHRLTAYVTKALKRKKARRNETAEEREKRLSQSRERARIRRKEMSAEEHEKFKEADRIRRSQRKRTKKSIPFLKRDILDEQKQERRVKEINPPCRKHKIVKINNKSISKGFENEYEHLKVNMYVNCFGKPLINRLLFTKK